MGSFAVDISMPMASIELYKFYRTRECKAISIVQVGNYLIVDARCIGLKRIALSCLELHWAGYSSVKWCG